jgi:hypothetical protein
MEIRVWVALDYCVASIGKQVLRVSDNITLPILGDAMDVIKQFWLEIWTYKISLVPVLLTYLLFDSQAIYRRATKTFYVPIYFMIFPSGHSDKLYAEYFSEDDFYGEGQAMSDAEKKALRQKIIIAGIFSMVFATIVAPYVCGLISALYLTPQQFTEFLWSLMIVKSALIVHALYRVRFDSRAVNRGHAFYYIIALYVAYLYFVWRGLTKSFNWAFAQMTTNGPWGLLNAVADFAHEEFFINVLVVSLLTWAVQKRFTTPENISPPE